VPAIMSIATHMSIALVPTMMELIESVFEEDGSIRGSFTRTRMCRQKKGHVVFDTSTIERGTP
jgi:hypothetical protein